MFVNENALDWSVIRTHSNDGVVGDFVSPVGDVFVSPVNEDIIGMVYDVYCNVNVPVLCGSYIGGYPLFSKNLVLRN